MTTGKGSCFAILVSLLFLAGCSGSSIETVPAKGKLTVNGQPAGGAKIIFVPQNVAPEAAKERPHATSQADGSFELSTIDPGDGAPIGDYKVLVTWPVESADPEASHGTDQLNFAYANEEKTTLTQSVTADAGQALNIDIQTAKR